MGARGKYPRTGHRASGQRSRAQGAEQIDLEYALPILIREHLEPAGPGFCSAHVIDENVEPAPLPLNAIDYLPNTGGRPNVRLYKKVGSLAFG